MNYTPSFDIAKAYTGGYGDFSGKLKSGSSGMDPWSLGLGLGSSLVGGLFGIGQVRTSAGIAQAQIDALRGATLENRNLRDFQEAAQRRGMLLAGTTLKDIEFGFQKRAKDLELGRLAERQLGLGSEQSKRERLARISPESKEAARFENRLAIERALAERKAVTDAVFGPVRGSFA